MTTQRLFYENATPIDRERHRDWCVDPSSQGYEFARNVNSVPLTAIEIPVAARDYSIVFAGKEGNVVPVAILGVEGNRNLYVGEDGSWNASYIPAFVRRPSLSTPSHLSPMSVSSLPSRLMEYRRLPRARTAVAVRPVA